MTMLTSLKALFSSAAPVVGAQPLTVDGSGFAAFLKAFTQQAAPDAPLPTPLADPAVAPDAHAAEPTAGLPGEGTASLPATPLETADAPIGGGGAHLPQTATAQATEAVAELPAAAIDQQTIELFDGSGPALQPAPIESPRIAFRAHKSGAGSIVGHAAETTASSLAVIDDESVLDHVDGSPELLDQNDGASDKGQSVQASIMPGASAALAPPPSAPAPILARNDMLQVSFDAPAPVASGVHVAPPAMPQPHASGDRSALSAHAQVIADTTAQDRPDTAPATAPAIDRGSNPGFEPLSAMPVAAGETPSGDARLVAEARQEPRPAAKTRAPTANAGSAAKDGAVAPEPTFAVSSLATPDVPVGKAAIPAVGSNPVMQDAAPRVAAPQIANAQIAASERGASQAAIPVVTATPAVVDQAPGIETLLKPAELPLVVASLTSPEPTKTLEADQTQSGPLLSQSPELRPRRSIGEALSLLQMAREQLHGRSSDVARHDGPLRHDPAAVVAPQPSVDPIGPATPAVASPAPTTPSALPTVDLAASLGARVVDLGVSGQWIDGIAREIASLSANGAQGRFQVNAGLLGDVQVDIRPGAGGAAVSLTVASDLAEQALRQESDRLKQDANLSAIRISDVRVERAPATEPSRSDGAGGQSFSQSQGGAGAPSHGQQQGGQPSAQPNMQGRGQSRENFPGGHKAGGGAAVLNHERSGADATDLPRARYA